jgi:hypothetical protein
MTALGRRVCVVLTLAVVAPCAACAGGAPTPATEASPEVAPYPFTVYQLKAGCASGRTIRYRFDSPTTGVKLERWTFLDIDPKTTEVTTTTYDEEGRQVGQPEVKRAQWAELHEHARFPYATTVITNEPITLPAGTFDAMRYVVTDGDQVKTLWFARKLPGPPVKMEITKGGRTVLVMTMEASRATPERSHLH